MGVQYNPGIITNGLVFAMDVNNRAKSWKGMPTTNLAPSAVISQQQTLVMAYVGMEDGWKKYSLGGTWTSGTYPYSMSVSAIGLTGGVTYSTGLFIRTNVPHKFVNLFGGVNYVNMPMDKGGSPFSILQPDGSKYIGRNAFQYTSSTTQPGYIMSQPVNGQVFDSAKDFLYVKDIQIEAAPYATPYTSGTRQSTESIIDLTGNTIATVSSLYSDADGSFSFGEAVASSITLPNISFPIEQTIEMWIKPTENDAVRRNPYNQAYGGHGTLTHEPNGTIVYFYGTSGANTTPYGSHSSGFTVLQNELACICITRRFADTKWYKNGILMSTAANVYGVLPADTNQIIIGNGYAGPYKGKIYSTKLYNRALSEQEVATNFQATRGLYGAV